MFSKLENLLISGAVELTQLKILSNNLETL